MSKHLGKLDRTRTRYAHIQATCRLLLLVDDCDSAVFVGDDDGSGQAKKHAVLDDTGDPEQAVADVPQVTADTVLEEHLHDVVAVVGSERRVRAVTVPLGGGGDGPEPAVEAGHSVEHLADESQRVGRAEGDDLDGDGARAPEPRHELGLVDDDDEPVPGALDHLLPEQRPAAALDEVEVRVDLVGAVDGEADAGAREREQRDPDAGGVGLRLEGGGHAGDPRKRARAEEVPQAVQRVRRRGPRAQAQRHAGLHELHRAVRRHALQLVLRQIPRRRWRRGVGGSAAHGVAREGRWREQSKGRLWSGGARIHSRSVGRAERLDGWDWGEVRAPSGPGRHVSGRPSGNEGPCFALAKLAKIGNFGADWYFFYQNIKLLLYFGC